MFGNRFGWGLAAVLAVGVMGLAFLVNKLATGISAPTRGVIAQGMDRKGLALDLETNTVMLDPIVLPFKATDLVPQMTQTEDAGPLYREAIKEYNDHPSTYGRDYILDRKTKQLRITDISQLPAMQKLIEARYKTTASIFRGNPESVINYRDTPVDIRALGELGYHAYTMALYMKEDNKQLATQLAEAAFALGVRMAEERLRHTEWDAGVTALREGALVLGSIDESKKDAAKRINDAMREFTLKRTIPMWYVIGSKDQGVIERTAGDVFYSIKNSREQLWKIEGLIKLGRYKFNAGKGADQRQAKIWVKRLKDDVALDKEVRLAAKVADEFEGD